MVRRGPVTGLLVLILLLAGCGGNPACRSDSAYTDSRSVADLSIPAGMSPPDTSEALRIPEETTAGKLHGQEGVCLDAPPRYYERPGAVAGSPEALIYTWSDAWNEKDAQKLFSLYAPDFSPPEGNLEEWREARRRQLADPEPTRVSIEALALSPAPGGQMQAQFVQRFEGSSQNFALRREMLLIRRDNNWLIATERVTDVL